MNSNTSIVLYVLAMVATIVIVDILFFRTRALARLFVNIGIVFIYVAFYLAFLKR